MTTAVQNPYRPNNSNPGKRLNDHGEELYCSCNGKDDGSFMICCDKCEVWFHGRCVGIKERDGEYIDKFVCPGCKLRGLGRTTYRMTKPVTQAKELSIEERLRNIREERAVREEQKRKRMEANNIQKQKRVTNNTPLFVEQTPQPPIRNGPQQNTRKSDNTLLSMNRKVVTIPQQPKVIPKPGPTPAQLKIIKKREMYVNKLKEALSLPLEGEDEINRNTYANPQDVARKIEDLLTRTLGSIASNKYSQKFRTLVFNLSDVKNTSLRTKILKNEITPENLINMTSTELANEDIKNKRKEIEKKALKNVLLNDSAVSIIKKTHKGETQVIENINNNVVDELNDFPNYDSLNPVLNDSGKSVSKIQSNTSDTISKQLQLEVESLKKKMEEMKNENALKLKMLEQSKKERKERKDKKMDEIMDEKSDDHISVDEDLNKMLIENNKMEVDSGIKLNNGNEKKNSPNNYEKKNSPSFNEKKNSPMNYERRNSPVINNQNHEIDWNGKVVYNLKECDVDIDMKMYHVNGPENEFKLPSTLSIVNRMDLDNLLNYIPKIDFSTSRNRTVCYFKPQNDKSKEGYSKLYQFLTKINRGGVFSLNKSDPNVSNFKELFVLPIKNGSFPSFISTSEIDTKEEEILIGVYLSDKGKTGESVSEKKSLKRKQTDEDNRIHKKFKADPPHDEIGNLELYGASLNDSQNDITTDPNSIMDTIQLLNSLATVNNNTNINVNPVPYNNNIHFPQLANQPMSSLVGYVPMVNGGWNGMFNTTGGYPITNYGNY